MDYMDKMTCVVIFLKKNVSSIKITGCLFEKIIFNTRIDIFVFKYDK